MKNISLALCIFLTALVGRPIQTYAYDTEGLYVGSFFGANFLSNQGEPFLDATSKTGYLIGVQMGYMFSNPFRIEGEFQWRANKLDGFALTKNLTIETLAFIANAYYDLDLFCNCSAFVGIGAGFAENRFKVESNRVTVLSSISRDFAYQVIVGSGYRLSRWIGLSCEYRFLGLKRHYFNHSVDFLIKYYF